MRLDSAYNNRLAVPSYVDFLARWKQRSEAVTQGEGLRFSQHASLSATTFSPQEVSQGLSPHQWGSDRCHVTHFKAPGAGPRPVLVYIHGGYWRALSPDYFHFLAPVWNALGADLALIGYDTDNHIGVDQIAAQCRAGLRWLFLNAQSLGIDPQRIVVSGHSAGGHLAAMAASEDGRQRVSNTPGQLPPLPPLSWLAGCVCLSGVFDLAPLTETSMQAGLGLTDAVIAAASPVHRRPNPEILTQNRLALFFGQDEIVGFHEQHAALIKAWNLEGRAVTQALPGIHHFSIVDTLVQPESQVFQTIAQMLQLSGSQTTAPDSVDV